MKKRFALSIMLIIAGVMLLLFCTGASAETEVTLNDKISYSGGYSRISWSVSGDEAESYRVYARLINNGTAEQTTWFQGETKSHSLSSVELLPGKQYEITVTDENYMILDQRQYSLNQAQTFVDGKLKDTSVKVTTELRKQTFGQKAKKVDSLKAVDIMNAIDNNTADYGIKFQMRMPQLAKQRAFFVTLAFESPDGYLSVEVASDVTFERVNNGYQTIWWDLVGDNFFKYLYAANRTIPSGTYNVYLFWDGMWVNTTSFKVR